MGRVGSGESQEPDIGVYMLYSNMGRVWGDVD